MPTHKAQKKSIITSEKRRIANKTQKTKIKSLFKTAAAAEPDKKEALLKEGYKTIDKACSKGIIKKNKAARKKSQLAKTLAK